MDTSFCTEALEETIDLYGSPVILNTDEGSQFTSEDFTTVLKNYDIKIGMDGKGRWIGTVFVGRFWRSVKDEEIYLKAYNSVAEAKRSLGDYFEFYNQKRRHQSLERQAPDRVHNQVAVRMAA